MNTRRRTIQSVGPVIILGLALSLMLPMAVTGKELPGYTKLTGSTEPGPGWTDLFDTNGKVKGLFGGQNAAFIEDNISAGVAIDMSKLVSDDIVDNGTVQAINDLGNTYVFQTKDTHSNTVLFVGVERMGVVEKFTYIDFELTQDMVLVRNGVPWEIHGERSSGDLLVRMNFVDGMLDSVDFKSFAADINDGAGDYTPIMSVYYPVGLSCDAGGDARFATCWGSPLPGLANPNSESWDLDGNPVEISGTDGFAELGVNVGRLLGFNPDFSSLTLRTAEDIAFGSGILQGRD